MRPRFTCLPLAIVLTLAAMHPVAAVAQAPFDSIAIWHQRSCDLPCIDYRITLKPTGHVTVDRSDSIAITMTFPAPALAALLDQFRNVGIDSVFGQIPQRTSDCRAVTEHSPTIIIALFVRGGQRNIRDEHFCFLNAGIVGDAQADRVVRLHDFETALDRAVGIDRWLVR